MQISAILRDEPGGGGNGVNPQMYRPRNTKDSPQFRGPAVFKFAKVGGILERAGEWPAAGESRIASHELQVTVGQ